MYFSDAQCFSQILKVFFSDVVNGKGWEDCGRELLGKGGKGGCLLVDTKCSVPACAIKWIPKWKTYISKDDEHTLQCVTITRGYGSPQTSQSFTLGKQWRSGRGVETVKEALTRPPPISHSTHLFLRKKCIDKEMYNEYETQSSTGLLLFRLYFCNYNLPQISWASSFQNWYLCVFV